MTAAAPGRQASRAAGGNAAGGPATLVLSRAVMPGHEQAFEATLHWLAAETSAFPGHQGLTVLRPQPQGPATYTIVAHFATRQDMDAWLSSDIRARPVLISQRARRPFSAGRANGWSGAGRRGTIGA